MRFKKLLAQKKNRKIDNTFFVTANFQPVGLHRCYIKLKLFDVTEFTV